MEQSPGATSRFYDAQARLLAAAGLLLRSNDHHVLLVKPHYKSVWHVPGGMVETGESPGAAAQREAFEEIGLNLPVGRLLSIDYKPATAERPAALQFVFDGGLLSDELIHQIKIQEQEIAGYGFFPPAKALAMVQQGGPAARLAHTLWALDQGTTVYLEDGRLV